MRNKIVALTLLALFVFSTNVYAMEKLPAEVLSSFQDDVGIFQNQMTEESDKTHHLTKDEIYQLGNKGYKVYRLDPNKILNHDNIDLYDVLISDDIWYIPVSDRIRYEVDKVDGSYKLVGYGVFDEDNAVSYEALEKIAIDNGLQDFVYVHEPALHVNGFVGKTSEGSKLLSFGDNKDLNLQKYGIKNGTELISSIRNKVEEAKNIGNMGYGGSGGLNNNTNQLIIFLVLALCIPFVVFMIKKSRFKKE